MGKARFLPTIAMRRLPFAGKAHLSIDRERVPNRAEPSRTEPNRTEPSRAELAVCGKPRFFDVKHSQPATLSAAAVALPQIASLNRHTPTHQNPSNVELVQFSPNRMP